MRNISSFFRDIVKKPPLVFPYMALFHVVMFLFTLWTYRTEPVFSVGWIQPLWMLLYTVFWLFVCDMRKWAAWGYLAITTFNLVLKFSLHSKADVDLYVSTMSTAIYLDVLFSFFILFYYKRFE